MYQYTGPFSSVSDALTSGGIVTGGASASNGISVSAEEAAPAPVSPALNAYEHSAFWTLPQTSISTRPTSPTGSINLGTRGAPDLQAAKMLERPVTLLIESVSVPTEMFSNSGKALAFNQLQASEVRLPAFSSVQTAIAAASAACAGDLQMGQYFGASGSVASGSLGHTAGAGAAAVGGSASLASHHSGSRPGSPGKPGKPALGLEIDILLSCRLGDPFPSADADIIISAALQNSLSKATQPGTQQTSVKLLSVGNSSGALVASSEESPMGEERVDSGLQDQHTPSFGKALTHY